MCSRHLVDTIGISFRFKKFSEPQTGLLMCKEAIRRSDWP